MIEGSNIVEGWLWRKNDGNTLDKPWSKYWAVLIFEVHSILFYKEKPTEVHFGTEEGIIDVGALSNVEMLNDTKEGRFLIVTHDNIEHRLHAPTSDEANNWVTSLKKFQSVSNSNSDELLANNEWNNINSRDRSSTDAVNDKILNSRNRKMTQLFQRMSSEIDNLQNEPIDLSRIRSGTFEMDLGDQKLNVEYHKDLSDRTTHCIWRFLLNQKKQTIELLHGRTFGKRVILVNADKKHESRKVLDAGSDHPLFVEGYELIIRIINNGFTGFKYRLMSILELKRSMEANNTINTTMNSINNQKSDDTIGMDYDTVDGWLYHKTEQRILGKARWKRYWCVYERDLHMIRFFETQQDYFCNDERGSINLQALKNVYRHETNKQRFDIITFDGHRHQIRTEDGQENLWINVCSSHKASTESYDENAAEWDTIQARNRANTDSVDAMVAKSRHRTVSSVMNTIDEHSTNMESLPPGLKKLEQIKRGTFKLVCADNNEIDIQYYKDVSERTSHCTWRFQVDEKTYTIELFHGRTWGRRRLVCNGDVIWDARKTLDDGSNHLLEIGNKRYQFVVQIINTGFAGFRYRLETLESLKEKVSEKNLANKMQPDKNSEMEGYISQKNDIVFGLGVYKKYYGVLERSLEAILLFQDHDSYLRGLELGIIHVHNLLGISLTSDSSEGAFDLLTNDGQKLRFRAPTLREAHKWVSCLLPYKVSLIESKHEKKNNNNNNNNDSSEWNNMPSRDRSNTDSLDELVIKTRDRKFSDYFRSNVDKKNPLAKVLRPISDSEHVSVGKFQLPTEKGDVEIEYVKDLSEATSHCTWRFIIDDEKYAVELFHGRKWGRRRILCNGNLVHDSRKTMDDGTNHLLEVKGRKIILRIICTVNTGFQYRLESYLSLKQKKDENNLALNIEPDHKTDVEGTLFTKSDEILGFNIWKKNWGVLDRTFKVICLYPSEDAYLKGQENDVIKLENVTQIVFPSETMYDAQFVLVANGIKYELKTNNIQDSRLWIACLKPFINGKPSRSNTRTSISNLPTRERTQSDTVDALIMKTRGRSVTSLFQSNPMEKALNAITSKDVKVGEYKMVLNDEEVIVNYFKDYSESTTRCLWKFNANNQEFKVELFHGRVFGRRTILVNDLKVHNSRKLLDSGSKHSLTINAQQFILLILPNQKSSFSYRLLTPAEYENKITSIKSRKKSLMEGDN